MEGPAGERDVAGTNEGGSSAGGTFESLIFVIQMTERIDGTSYS